MAEPQGPPGGGDIEVEAPDGKRIAFPSSMSKDDIGTAMRKLYPPQNQSEPKAIQGLPAPPFASAPSASASSVSPSSGGSGASMPSVAGQAVSEPTKPGQYQVDEFGDGIATPHNMALANTEQRRGTLFRNHDVAVKSLEDLEQQYDDLQKQKDVNPGLRGNVERIDKQLGEITRRAAVLRPVIEPSRAAMDREVKATVEESVSDVKAFTQRKGEFDVVDPAKIDAEAKRLAEKYGASDTHMYRRFYNALTGKVEAGIIEPEADKIFKEKAAPLLAEASKKMEDGFTTDDVEQAKAASRITAAKGVIEAQYGFETKSLEQEAKAAYDQVTAPWKQREVEYKQSMDLLQQRVNSGQVSQEAAQAELELANAQYSKEYQQYSDAAAKANDDIVKRINAIGARYNDRFSREQQRIWSEAQEKVAKAADMYAASYKGDPEQKKRLDAMYSDAWKEAISNRAQAIDKADTKAFVSDAGLLHNVTLPAMKWFGKSFVSGLGGAFKGISTTVGSDAGYLLGDEMERAFLMPEPKAKEWSDLLDVRNLSMLSGQLAGGMAPSLVAAGGVAAATGGMGAPTSVSLVASGLAGWGAETADIAGRTKDQVFAKTGDITKANEAARKSFVSQAQLLPTYAFEGLPFVGKALGGIASKGGRIAAGVGIEYVTEAFQEIPQGIAEKNIVNGREAWDDFTAGLSDPATKETLIMLAPISLLGGAGQVNSQSNDQRLQEAVKTYIGKGAVAKYVDTAAAQWIGDMREAKGDNFTSAVIASLYTSGHINEKQALKLQLTQQQAKSDAEEAGRAILNPGGAKVYTAFAAKSRDLKERAGKEESPILKKALEQRAKEIDASMVDAVNMREMDHVSVTYANGSSTILDMYEAQRMLNDPDFARQVALVGEGRGGITLEATGVDGTSLMVEFMERTQRVKDYMALARLDPEKAGINMVPTKNGPSPEQQLRQGMNDAATSSPPKTEDEQTSKPTKTAAPPKAPAIPQPPVKEGGVDAGGKADDVAPVDIKALAQKVMADPDLLSVTEEDRVAIEENMDAIEQEMASAGEVAPVHTSGKWKVFREGEDLMIRDKDGNKPSDATASKVMTDMRKNYNYAQGKTIADLGIEPQNESDNSVYLKSENPAEIAAVLAITEKEIDNEGSFKEQMIAQVIGGGRVQTKSFTGAAGYGAEDVGGKKGERGSRKVDLADDGKALDMISLEASGLATGDYNANEPYITEEDVVDWVNKYGSVDAFNRKVHNPLYSDLRDRFKTLTGFAPTPAAIERAIQQHHEGLQGTTGVQSDPSAQGVGQADAQELGTKEVRATDSQADRLAAEVDAARAARDAFVNDFNDRGQGLFAPGDIPTKQQTIDDTIDNSKENFDAKVEPLNERVRQATKALADYVERGVDRAQAAAQQTSIPNDGGKPLFQRTATPKTGIGHVDKVLKALEVIAPGITVTLHKDPSAFSKASKEAGGRGLASDAAFYDPKANAIHINVKLAGDNTLFHEASHPLLRAAIANDPTLLHSLFDGLSKHPDGAKYKEFGAQYGDKPISEKMQEALAEFLADVASGKVKSSSQPDSLWQRFKAWLNDILSKLGFSPGKVNISDNKDLRSFADAFAKAVNKGIRIEGVAPVGDAGTTSLQQDADAVVDGWYSRLDQAVAAKGNTQSGADWMKWAEARAKEGALSMEEVKWTGLADFLQGKARVAPQEVRAFLKENRVKVEVVINEDEPLSNAWQSVGGGTKFSEYQLPGGTNYREVLVTLPKRGALQSELETQAQEQYGKPYAELNDAQQKNTLSYVREARKDPEFQSSHFDEPNILVHLRLNDRTDADGKKMLFIEEMQSDFGQSLRKLEASIDQNFDDIIEKMKADGVLKKRCP